MLFSWARYIFCMGKIHLNFSFVHSAMQKPFLDSQDMTVRMNRTIQLVSEVVVGQCPLLHRNLDTEIVFNDSCFYLKVISINVIFVTNHSNEGDIQRHE